MTESDRRGVSLISGCLSWMVIITLFMGMSYVIVLLGSLIWETIHR